MDNFSTARFNIECYAFYSDRLDRELPQCGCEAAAAGGADGGGREEGCCCNPVCANRLHRAFLDLRNELGRVPTYVELHLHWREERRGHRTFGPMPASWRRLAI